MNREGVRYVFGQGVGGRELPAVQACGIVTKDR